MLNGAKLASGGKNANSKIHNVVNCLMFADLYLLSEIEIESRSNLSDSFDRGKTLYVRCGALIIINL